MCTILDKLMYNPLDVQPQLIRVSRQTTAVSLVLDIKGNEAMPQ